VDVVRDVLDKAVVDRNGREMGRVDGIVVAVRDGAPPRLDAILIGPVALGERLHPGVGRLVGAVERRLGLDPDRPVRVEFRDIETVERKVRVRLTVGETAAEAVEQRLRGWVGRLPGSR
jgi:sporulation protein YlmC with PRC-barrel domain